MQTFDFSKTSKHKATATIDREYGGRAGFLHAVINGAVGIGQLQYHSGIPHVDKIKDKKMRYNANLEIYPSGLGIYAYNVDYNYLTLLHVDEIKAFVISKPLDVIKPAKFSFFTKMKSWGLDYYTCKYMLLDHEIVEIHPISLDIVLKDGQSIHTTIRKRHPHNHQKFILNNSLNIPCDIKIQGHLELEEDL